MKQIPLKTGERFGRMTVVQLDRIYEHIGKNGRMYRIEYYLCVCDCGRLKVVPKPCLKRGHTKSCGCLNTARGIRKKANNKKHGMIKTRLYKCWDSMKDRCRHNQRYINKGIGICDEWAEDFETFMNWAFANGYTDELTLDRIDNSGDYCPENCRWVTKAEQSRNRDTSHFVTINGVTKTFKEWCVENKVHPATAYTRIRDYGWNIERALTTPSPHA